MPGARTLSSRPRKDQSNLRAAILGHWLTPLFMLVIAWLVFISWRPLVLGFYHDDWSLLTVTSPYGAPLIAGGQTRPLNVALGHLGVTLFGSNTVLWHVYGVVLVLITSGCAYLAALALAKGLAPRDEQQARWVAASAALAWMLVPTSLGYAAWPVMFPGLWCVSLVMLTIYLVISHTDSLAHLLLAAALLLISTLIYEAFWFSFAPIALLVLAVDPQKSWFGAVRTFLVLGAAQLAVIGWSLYLAATGGGGGKRLNPDFLRIAGVVPRWLADLLGVSPLVSIALLLLAAAALTVSFWRFGPHRGAILAIAASAVGAAASMTLFYAAGYALTLTGVFSRTYIAFNVWLCLAVVVAVVTLLSLSKPWQRRALWAVILGGVTIMGTKTIAETLRWAESWSFQQRVLASIPDTPPVRAGRTAIILAFPDRADKIESIGAFWDATAALYVARPGWRSQISDERVWATVSHEGEWNTAWDGRTVSQYWCRSPDTPLWRIDADAVLIFRPQDQELRAMTPGTSMGCDTPR